MKIETLKNNEWLSLKKIVAPEHHVNGYVYSHEERCNGEIVAILPFRYKADMIEYLLRNEVTPCWHLTEPQVSALTGGVEDDGVILSALRELEEESGYKVSEDELIHLGTCRGTKSCDTIYHLFSVNLTDHERGEALGDGSSLENYDSYCYWDYDIDEAVDPVVYVLFDRLNRGIIE